MTRDTPEPPAHNIAVVVVVDIGCVVEDLLMHSYVDVGVGVDVDCHHCFRV